MQKKNVALIIKGFGVIALAMWFYAGHLYNVFRTYPTAPSPETGNIVPFLWKTQNVYISENENLEYNVLFYGAIVVFVLAALAFTWAQKKFNDLVLFPESQMREPPGRAQKTVMIVIFVLVIALTLYSYLRPRFG